MLNKTYSFALMLYSLFRELNFLKRFARTVKQLYKGRSGKIKNYHVAVVIRRLPQ